MRLLLVEDEASAARRLTRLVAEHFAGKVDLVHVAQVGAAIDELNSARFDGVLLDLNLGGADGFEVIRAARDTPFVIVSAYASRSLEAFDHAVLDFVPKPVVPARLAKALDRLAAAGQAPRRASLIVRAAGRAEIVDCGRLVRIQGADDYAELVLADGRHLLHDGSLALLDRRLPQHFIRIHRSHIVNGLHVTSIAHEERGAVIRLTNGDTVPIGRRRHHEVYRRLALRD